MSARIIWTLITTITLVTSILIYLKFKIRDKKAFVAFYSEKRKEFPWLDNYLKQNKADPAKIRPYQEGGLLGKIIFFLVIAIAGGWALTGIINFLWYLIYISTPLIKTGVIKFLVDNTGLIIAYFIALKIIFNNNILNGIHDTIGMMSKYLPHKFFRVAQPDKIPVPEVNETEVPKFTLECPSCHCPHSWVITRFQNIIESSSTTKITTTTTRHNSADDYGGGFIGQMAAGSSTSSSTTSRTSYSGRADKDFICLNCGHTLNENNHYTWDSYPAQGEKIYDPPLNSWDSKVGGFSKLLKIGILFLIVYFAGQSFIGFLYGLGSAIRRHSSTVVTAEEIANQVQLTVISNTYLFNANGDPLKRLRKGQKVVLDGTRETLAEKFIPVIHGRTRGYIDSTHTDQ